MQDIIAWILGIAFVYFAIRAIWFLIKFVLFFWKITDTKTENFFDSPQISKKRVQKRVKK